MEKPDEGAQGEELPEWLVGLARHVVRACRRPGTYQILLIVPIQERRKPEYHLSKVDEIYRPKAE